MPRMYCARVVELALSLAGLASRRLELALSLALLAACGGGPGATAPAEPTGESKPAQTGSTAQPSTDGKSARAGGAARASSGTAGKTMQPAAAGSPAAGSSNPSSGPTMAAMTSPTGASGTNASSDTAGMSAQPAAGSGAAGMGGPAAGSGAVQTPCATSNTLKAGDSSKMLMHGGRDRHFTVYVPSSVSPMTPAPLVLDFHGNGSNGMQEESGSGWRQKADAEHFIVAFPDGVGNGWNVGNCCGEALNSMVDDVGFARAIVENISSEACIDVHRTYATGISNGAGLAHRLACEAADVFAAIAAASADLVTDPCTPARPISEISVRGLSDTLVAYEGGNTGSTGWYSPGAKGTLDLWKKIDGCSGTSSMSMEYCETYTQCMAGVEVTLCSLPGTGHILYTNSLGFSVPDTAWEMFKRQTLP